MLNFLQNLLCKDIVHITWNGTNKDGNFHKILVDNKTNETLQYIEGYRGQEDTLFYVDSLGGYIEPDTKLFIYKNKLYRTKG
jgi:hypothetical protein